MENPQNLRAAQEQLPGIFDSLRRLLGTLAAIMQTRIELLGTEVEEQVARLVSMLLWTIIALFCGFTAAILIAIVVLLTFWDTNRMLAAVLLVAGYASLGLLAWLRIRSLARARPRLFQATLEELAKDRDRLGGT
ncbi:MAG: phage holin family protein [Burkholderiales bacterium]|jgi:uncharacterized membrane protein YqjE